MAEGIRSEKDPSAVLEDIRWARRFPDSARPVVCFGGEIVGHLRVLAPPVAVLSGDEMGGPPVLARMVGAADCERLDVALLLQLGQSGTQNVAGQRLAARRVGQRDRRLGVGGVGELAASAHPRQHAG